MVDQGMASTTISPEQLELFEQRLLKLENAPARERNGNI